MTENRCIEVLKKMKHMFTETCAKIDENTALDMAVETIKELQQYKAKVQEYEAIGTVEECRTAYAKGYNQGTIDRAEELQKCREYGYNKAIDDFTEQIRVHYALRQELGYVADTYEKIIKNVFEYAEKLKGNK